MKVKNRSACLGLPALSGTPQAMSKSPIKCRGLQFTIRQYLGLVAIVTVAIGGYVRVVRARKLAFNDQRFVHRWPHLEFEHFFYRRLQGLEPPTNVHEVAQTLDWHERWDHYVVSALILAVSAILLALWARRAPRGRPRLDRVLFAALLFAGLLGVAADRAVLVNRAYLRSSTLRLPGPPQIEAILKSYRDFDRTTPELNIDSTVGVRERLEYEYRVRLDLERKAYLPWHQLVLPQAEPEVIGCEFH